MDLIKPWTKKGKLPNFAKVMSQGVYGNLISTTPPESPIAWCSLLTGKNPGKHNIFGFSKRIAGTYTLSPVNSSDVKAETIFEILSKNQKKVIGVSIPIMYPIFPVNGIMIPGLLSPPYELYIYPPELKQEINDKLGKIKVNIDTSLVYKSKDKFLDDVHKTTKNIAELSLYLMNTRDWDFFMVVMHAADEVQHFFWKYLYQRNKYSNAILKTYQLLDSIVAQLLNYAGRDTIVFIVSDHGHGYLKGYFCTNIWLEKQNLLKFKRDIKWHMNRFLYKSLKTIRVQHRVLKMAFKCNESFKKLKKMIKSKESEANSILSSIDFNQTRAYAYDSNIYINLKGREPLGLVKRMDYEEIREVIINKLKKLGKPSGGKLFHNVLKRDEVYSGPFISEAPDIIIDYESYLPFGLGGLGSHSFYGSVFEEPPFLSGYHRKDGILIVYGSGINKNNLGQVNIMDVIPTILNILGCPIDNDMDGKPIKNLVKDLGESSAREIEPSNTYKRRYIWSKDEEEKIKQKLRALGYID
jgi:predicted AlkP superfamily phosphohydrolase/phosphomutase